jgi:hypothetical protein
LKTPCCIVNYDVVGSHEKVGYADVNVAGGCGVYDIYKHFGGGRVMSYDNDDDNDDDNDNGNGNGNGNGNDNDGDCLTHIPHLPINTNHNDIKKSLLERMKSIVYTSSTTSYENDNGNNVAFRDGIRYVKCYTFQKGGILIEDIF